MKSGKWFTGFFEVQNSPRVLISSEKLSRSDDTFHETVNPSKSFRIPWTSESLFILKSNLGNHLMI